jgi:hypothetical protein
MGAAATLAEPQQAALDRVRGRRHPMNDRSG